MHQSTNARKYTSRIAIMLLCFIGRKINKQIMNRINILNIYLFIIHTYILYIKHIVARRQIKYLFSNKEFPNNFYQRVYVVIKSNINR